MRFVWAAAIVVYSWLDLANAKRLWSTTPATYGSSSGDTSTYILKTGFLVGNGKLGAIPFGTPGAEKINFNVDSLWSGGPFQVSNYTGGNPTGPVYQALPEIRSFIFQNGTGNVTALLGGETGYGSNRVLGNVTITIPGIDSFTNYTRSLDLDTALHSTTFSSEEDQFNTTIFCSYPDQVCVYSIESTSELPTITVSFEDLLDPANLSSVACSEGSVKITGYTQQASPLGMKFYASAKAIGGSTITSCPSTGGLAIESGTGRKSQTIVISGGTDYDQDAGNARDGFSFQGKDPVPVTDALISTASSKTYENLLHTHVNDYQSIFASFKLDLPDVKNSSALETSAAIARYNWTDTSGDPFIESLLFDYSRYLLISSSRDNSLPANLLGRWTEALESPWSADYHLDINLQMNYWAAEQTGLQATESALFNYMEDTWVPRGIETARLLYNGSGWVLHDEVNIFGHTAMKEAALWADYPAAAAWMMQQVWDHFDYTQDVAWLTKQGYPLMKGVAQFWVSQLQEDLFFNDGTLVVNPCNSPEIGPTTFGCAHYQQLLHQLFNAILSSASLVGEKDESFLSAVSSSLSRLDSGIHFTDWGGIKEWKLPDSYGYDVPSTHRHLSHLVGWYPGYSMSSYAGGYTNATIQSAVKTTLISRGLGNGADANAGWEKVWRGACWARLNDSAMAYEELRYAIDTNFAGNGLSMYSADDPPFQIDANFGLAGNMLNMLVVDMPLPAGLPTSQSRIVVLGPAIPSSWGGGSITGLNVRGGVTVDFEWNSDGIATSARPTSSGKAGRSIIFVDVTGKRLAET
ncbi:glycoside hydrolase family 95 protein [Xylariaceae sp. FL0255]|nr:glycoside hydrolase family 95 protein [Xylariaceae sp. FL0255]